MWFGINESLNQKSITLSTSTNNTNSHATTIDVSNYSHLSCTCTISGYAYTSLTMTGSKKDGSNVTLCSLYQPYPATGTKTRNIDVDILEYKTITVSMSCYQNSSFEASASISNFCLK